MIASAAKAQVLDLDESPEPKSKTTMAIKAVPEVDSPKKYKRKAIDFKKK